MELRLRDTAHRYRLFCIVWVGQGIVGHRININAVDCCFISFCALRNSSSDRFVALNTFFTNFGHN